MRPDILNETFARIGWVPVRNKPACYQYVVRKSSIKEFGVHHPTLVIETYIRGVTGETVLLYTDHELRDEMFEYEIEVEKAAIALIDETLTRIENAKSQVEYKARWGNRQSTSRHRREGWIYRLVRAVRKRCSRNRSL